MYLARVGWVLCVLASLSACSAMQLQRNQAMDAELQSGNYRSAAMLAEKRLGLKPEKDGTLPSVGFVPAGVLNHLEAAEAWRMAGEADRALAHFDAAEESLKSVELQNVALSGAKQMTAVLGNDGALDYLPSPAEAVLINYYKALTFWTKGDVESTRVELNRADDRIRRSVERYESEIAKAQAAAEKNKGPSFNDPNVTGALGGKFADMSQWKPYQNFVMPQATYLQALFLGRSSAAADHQKAAELFGRVAGIVDDPSVLEADIADARVSRLCPTNNCVWVLFESGEGPVLEERRVDIPIATTNGLVMTSVALPALVSRASAAPSLSVTNEKGAVSPKLIASMDRVVQTEFQKRFPAVVTRAVASAAVKTIAQAEINRQVNNPLVSLIGSVMTMASTSADTRVWRSLPATFSVVRLAKTGGPLTFATEAGNFTVDVPDTGSQLIHIKAPRANVPPAVAVIEI